MNKAYLGDSVYVQMDELMSGAIVLTTENGLPKDPSNRIVLEAEVIENLLRYLKSTESPAPRDPPDQKSGPTLPADDPPHSP
jgi:hypothetical protein